MEHFLQLAFRIVLGGFAGEGAKVVAGHAENEAADGFQIAVEIHGADQGLEGIGQSGGALASATGLLPATQHEVVAETKGRGVLFQALARDETGAEFGELSFAEGREKAVEVVGDDELQDRVAEELEALVVEMEGFAFERQAGVGEGLGEEEGVTELVADVPLQWIHVRGELRRGEVGGRRVGVHDEALTKNFSRFCSLETRIGQMARAGRGEAWFVWVF